MGAIGFALIGLRSQRDSSNVPPMMTRWWVAAALVASAACSSKDGSKSDKTEPSSVKSPDKPADDPLAVVLPKQAPDAFAAWDMLGRAKAWQGAWVTEQSLGSAIALEVKGAAVTSWDGKAEKKLGFALESPCSAKLTEETAGGKTSTVSHFTVKDGKLVTGLGDAGSRKGKAAVACVSNKILTLDEAGKCVSWDNMFDKWKSEPATCKFDKQDGKDVFVASVNGRDTTLMIDGDALLSEQLAKVSAKSHPDFAAAKAARDK